MPSGTLELFQAEVVFSVCFFLGFIGFGVWFARSGWPWLTSYWEKRQELAHILEKQRAGAESQNDANWRQTADRMASAVEANTQALIHLAERPATEVKCPFIDGQMLLDVLSKIASPGGKP